MVGPTARRNAARHLAGGGHCSQRTACRVLGLNRSTVRYRPRRPERDEALRARIVELAREKGCYGCVRVWALLRREGWKVNRKRVHRLWKQEGLMQPRRRPGRRQAGPKGEVHGRAERPHHVWSYDFIEDRTERGGKLKMLTVLDEFTRRCLAIRVERRLSSTDVIETLKVLFARHGAPGYLRSDNGPEFIAQAVQEHLESYHTGTIYITPGHPWENPYTESFHDKLRRECLNREIFASGREAQVIVETYRNEYNDERPHSSLGQLTPEEFAANWKGGVAQPSASLRPNTNHAPKASTL